MMTGRSTVISHALSKQGYQVGATTSVAGYGIWPQRVGDVLITDVNFPDGDALDLLPRLQEKRRFDYYRDECAGKSADCDQNPAARSL